AVPCAYASVPFSDAEKLAYRLPSLMRPSTIGKASPRKLRLLVSKACAISVPSRLKSRWSDATEADDSTCNSVGASGESSVPMRTRAGFEAGQHTPIVAVKMKWRPPGKNDGNLWLGSPYASSIVYAACGMPPADATRCSGPLGAGAKTMMLSRFQAPPRPLVASHKTTGGPPAMFTFFSCPLAKKATYRLSGDQNGNEADSVPGKTWASSALTGRSHSWYPA